MSKHDGVLVDIIRLLAGLALIVKGGDWFVAAALRVAGFLRMPRVVIGSTLVSLATTSPEMVVSIMHAAITVPISDTGTNPSNRLPPAMPTGRRSNATFENPARAQARYRCPAGRRQSMFPWL